MILAQGFDQWVKLDGKRAPPELASMRRAVLAALQRRRCRVPGEVRGGRMIPTDFMRISEPRKNRATSSRLRLFFRRISDSVRPTCESPGCATTPYSGKRGRAEEKIARLHVCGRAPRGSSATPNGAVLESGEQDGLGSARSHSFLRERVRAFSTRAGLTVPTGLSTGAHRIFQYRHGADVKSSGRSALRDEIGPLRCLLSFYHGIVASIIVQHDVDRSQCFTEGPATFARNTTPPARNQRDRAGCSIEPCPRNGRTSRRKPGNTGL